MARETVRKVSHAFRNEGEGISRMSSGGSNDIYTMGTQALIQQDGARNYVGPAS